MVGLLSTSILRGQAIDQRKLDYERGFWDGAKHVVTRPENAEAELESSLKRLEEGTLNE
jgi:exonuclease VII small subunit